MQGKVGWAYAPEVDYFAFETIDYWILVKKKNLQDLVADKCKSKIKTNSPGDALYKLYTRQGRKDILTKVKTLDICYCADLIMKK